MSSTAATTSTGTPASMAFEISGLLTDTSIEVFGRIFHVHSSVLRIHSEFFRESLDSADKPAPFMKPGLGYRYITVVDEADDTWYLEATCKVTERGERGLPVFGGDVAQEQTCFENLLKAMYTKQFELGSVDELTELAAMADCYRAIPVVSHCLSNILAISPGIRRDISRTPVKVLTAAYKLRHTLLYRECYIIAIAKWEHSGSIDKCDEPRVSKSLQHGYGKLCVLLHEVGKHLLSLEKNYGNTFEWDVIRHKAFRTESLPLFYSDWYASSMNKFVRSAIQPLLRNNLEFEDREDYPNYFLCSKVSADDFPWELEAGELERIEELERVEELRGLMI